MAKLVYTSHTGQRNEFELGSANPIAVVGRMAECQIRTVDTSVSRRHSQFTWKLAGDRELVEVQDLGSSNGTFVNDQPVNAPTSLNPNDKVRCGNFQIDFFPGAPQRPGPSPMGGRMAGPPAAGAPTQFGPGAGGMGPPGHAPGPSSSGGGGGAGLPYLDDPSMAISPGQAAAAMGSPGPPRDYGPPPGHSRPPAPPPRPAPAPPPPRHGPPGPQVPMGLAPDQLRAELDRALRQVDALSREVDELRYENGRLRSSGGGGADYGELRRAQGELERLRADNNQLRGENEALRKEEGRVKAQMDAMSDRNVEVKEQFSLLQENQSELRDKLREAREDLDNALFKRDELAADVERLEKDKVELFDQLTKLKIEYNHLERAHESMRKDHGLLEYEYKRLDETNQELERELRATLEGESEQTDTLRRLQDIVDEKEALIKDLRDRETELKAEMKAQSQEDTRWMVEIEQLKQENEELLVEREELAQRLDEMQEVVSAQKATATAATEETQEELVNLREEAERLRRRLENRVSTEAYEKVLNANEEMRHEVTKLQQLVDENKQATPAGASELLAQIRELTDENHRLEAKLREATAVTATSPGDIAALPALNREKAIEVFEMMNSMVSAWRANLETMQVSVSDLTDLFNILGGVSYEGMDGKNRTTVEGAFDEADPEWACESMGDTVGQILEDSKRIKTMLLELRDQLMD